MSTLFSHLYYKPNATDDKSFLFIIFFYIATDKMRIQREIDIFTCMDVAIVHQCNSAQLAAGSAAHTTDFEIIHLYLLS